MARCRLWCRRIVSIYALLVTTASPDDEVVEVDEELLEEEEDNDDDDVLVDVVTDVTDDDILEELAEVEELEDVENVENVDDETVVSELEGELEDEDVVPILFDALPCTVAVVVDAVELAEPEEIEVVLEVLFTFGSN